MVSRTLSCLLTNKLRRSRT